MWEGPQCPDPMDDANKKVAALRQLPHSGQRQPQAPHSRNLRTLPKFMHDFMSYVAGKTGRFLHAHDTAWQDGYYDTHVKTAKQF